MYRKNKRSQQPMLISNINDLSERSRNILKHSWADTFRRELFLRIPEEKFKVLYDPGPSRPNVPVNILVGLEIIDEFVMLYLTPGRYEVDIFPNVNEFITIWK